MNSKFPEVGAFYSETSTVFRVWAPEKNQVNVKIAGTVYPMQQDKLGVWSAEIDNISPGTAYKFLLDPDKELPDPASLNQPDGVHGPSAVVDRTFPWTDSSWTGISLGEMIIYELHVGTFTTEGTFASLIKKLPYLKDLGVNAIEIMPVSQFPGERNWGYDGVYPFCVQNSYGGVSGLKEFVNEAHKHEIAVILDVVYNHQGPEGNYFSEFGPYFSDKYKTNWGSAINFDGPHCDGVRNFYWQNAMMWLNEFHIDGLRLDAVHAIWDLSAPHFIEELSAKVHAFELQSGRKKVLIAEFDLNNPRYITKKSKGGYGLDGQWIDEFHHALHALITGEKDGYYEDFGDLEHLAKSFRDSYVYTGQYSLHRKRNFGTMPLDAPYSQFVVFSQNHDQIGNRFLGERLTTMLSFEQLKLTAATYLLSPHVPMLFMGEEYGERNPFQYFISHTDENLVELVREGRKKEFSYFKSDGNVPDPFTRQTFDDCVLSWNTKESEAMKLLDFYKTLIHFRKTRKAFHNKERNSLIVWPVDNQEVLVFEKFFGSDRIIVVLNFHSQRHSIQNQTHESLDRIFDSSAKAWGGPGGDSAGSAPLVDNMITVNGHSATVFEVKAK